MFLVTSVNWTTVVKASSKDADSGFWQRDASRSRRMFGAAIPVCQAAARSLLAKSAPDRACFKAYGLLRAADVSVSASPNNPCPTRQHFIIPSRCFSTDTANAVHGMPDRSEHPQANHER